MVNDDDRFEWDLAKAEANRLKHRVDFSTASGVFGDPFGIEAFDPRHHGEDRFLLTGMVGGVLLTVVYTERRDRLRIISARRATKDEHDDYYRQNSQE